MYYNQSEGKQLKMKIIVILFSILTLILCRYIPVSRLLWIFAFPGIFCIITTYNNKFRRKISYYNDFPNVLRVFFACLGGTLLEAYNVFDVIMGLLFILLGIFANDEPMRRVYRNKGVIVLSGIDGTGKSTHAQRIHEWLGQNGIPSKIVPFHNYIFLDHLSKVRIKIKRGKMEKPQRKPPPGWVPAKTSKFSFIRPYLATLDNFLSYLFRVVPIIWKGQYVICDRFIWDNYVKHKALGYNTRFLFGLATLIKPKIGIIFDVPPEVAVERVRQRDFHYQYTKEHYEIERKEFKKIGKQLGYPIINTNQPIEKTWEQIENYLSSFLKKR